MGGNPIQFDYTLIFTILFPILFTIIFAVFIVYFIVNAVRFFKHKAHTDQEILHKLIEITKLLDQQVNKNP